MEDTWGRGPEGQDLQLEGDRLGRGIEGVVADAKEKSDLVGRENRQRVSGS